MKRELPQHRGKPKRLLGPDQLPKTVDLEWLQSDCLLLHLDKFKTKSGELSGKVLISSDESSSFSGRSIALTKGMLSELSCLTELEF